jgi:plastocyanin
MMLRQFTILLAAMATAVVAQSGASASDSGPSPTASSTSTAAAATHTVKVGFPIGQHAFSPENTVATLGDTISMLIAFML